METIAVSRKDFKMFQRSSQGGSVKSMVVSAYLRPTKTFGANAMETPSLQVCQDFSMDSTLSSSMSVALWLTKAVLPVRELGIRLGSRESSPVVVETFLHELVEFAYCLLLGRCGRKSPVFFSQIPTNDVFR
jgi:hypothetical protein